MNERYLDMEFDPGNKFTLPYMWGTTVLAYRKDHFTTPPKQSLSLLFDPAFRGKVSMLDERNECFAMMLQRLGRNLKSASVKDLNDAREELLTLVKDQKVKFGSDNGMKAHLLDGASSVAMIYSGDAAIIAQENPNIGYFIPEEGAVMWIDNFAIPRDSIRQNNAHRFIDFMMEAETAAASSNFLRYASPNKAAEPLLEKSLLEDATVYPSPELLARCRSMPVWSLDEQRAMNEGWKLVQQGAREYQKDLGMPDAPSPLDSAAPVKAAAPDAQPDHSEPEPPPAANPDALQTPSSPSDKTAPTPATR
jgi:spermidine/putrescine transport system substrate-binding protein